MRQVYLWVGAALVGLGILLGVCFLAPMPIPYYQDFSVMYFTNNSLLHGIAVYDFPAQVKFVTTLAGSNFTFHPFPYPPWYSLLTIFLGLMPIQAAARLWFFSNIAMISASAWLLTPGWRGTWRLLWILAAIMFIPAFGLLMVGQFSAPVLLGAALFVHAGYLIRKNEAQTTPAILAALALLLMTFKPHIGGLLLLAGLVWLLLSGREAGRKAILYFLSGGLFLALIGFIADPAWPLTYLQSLLRYRNIPGVQTCGLCASLPVALYHLVTGRSDTLASATVSLALVLVIGAVLFWRFRDRLHDPATMMSVMVLATLVVDPYLLNYDYLLLIIPLTLLVRSGDRLAWAAYLIPWVVLLLGRSGNVFLAVSAVLAFILISIRSIDLVLSEAYNLPTT